MRQDCLLSKAHASSILAFVPFDLSHGALVALKKKKQTCTGNWVLGLLVKYNFICNKTSFGVTAFALRKI